MKINLCYKLDSQLQMAVDDNGDAADVFMKISIDVLDNLNNDEIKELSEIYRSNIAKRHQVDIDSIVPLSYEEYITNVEDDLDCIS